jgi:TonB family protein
MERQTSRNFRTVITLAAVALLASTIAQANDLERHLRDQYRGKILALRGFYSGERLRYDSTGAIAGGRDAGEWTIDGIVQVNDIHVSGQTLKIKAKRLMVVSSGRNGLHFNIEVASGQKTVKKAFVVVELEARMDGDGTEGKANAILSRIFLTSQDNFAEAVPDFWRSCIADGLSGKNESCRFSPEMAAVPGMSSPVATTNSSVSPSEQNCPPACETSAANSGALFRVGHGVKPPRAIYQPEPEFSDPARKAKYQGVMTMGLIVDKEGHPQNIHILSPLGAGLDAKAVKAVETWKFQPAQKDGEPVAVQIAVEVDFHLY